MAVSFRTQLLAGYGSASLVLLVGGLALYQKNLSDESQQQVQHSRVVIRQALEAQNALLEAETSVRGYLLSGDRAYLAPYTASLPVAPQRIEELARSVSDNPRQRAAVDSLRAGTRKKLDIMADVIRRRDAGEDILPIIRIGAGKVAMDGLRADFASLIDDEQRIFESREQHSEQVRFVTQLVIALGSSIGFAIGLVVVSWIGRGFREREESRRHLEKTNARLEEQKSLLKEQEVLLARRLGEQVELARQLNQNNVALERSNQDLEQFAYITSHDLRAPLRGIANLSGWIEDDLGAAITPDVHKHLEMMRGRVRRLEALIDGITAYSRAGRGKTPVEAVDVGKLLSEAIELLAPPPGVKVTVDSSMPTLRTARVPLQQVLMNLIGNAIKYGSTPESGTVRVSSQDAGPFVEFRVSDHGPGIAPEHHDRIFGIFQTLSARDKVEGTGIGLAIVKKLVERYGGTIRVESDVGRGATFVFTWPRELSNDQNTTNV